MQCSSMIIRLDQVRTEREERKGRESGWRKLMCKYIRPAV